MVGQTFGHKVGPAFGILPVFGDRAHAVPKRERVRGVEGVFERVVGEGRALLSAGDPGEALFTFLRSMVLEWGATDRGLAEALAGFGIDVKTADSPMIPFDNRYHVPDFSYVRIEGPARSMTEALTMLAEMLRVPAWDEHGWRADGAGHAAAR